MRKRKLEVLCVLTVVAVMTALAMRNHHGVEPVTRPGSTPKIILARESRMGKLLTREPVTPLNPNLEREATLIQDKTLSISGVRLGMSPAEVREVLGEPQDQGGAFTEQGWMVYDSTDPELVDLTEIQFRRNRVVEVTGTLLHHGEQSFATNERTLPLLDYFGPNDFQHAIGAGGSPVLCWSGKTAVLEVETFVHPGKTGLFHLGDPGHFRQQPHLWYTSCGAVIEPTSE